MCEVVTWQSCLLGIFSFLSRSASIDKDTRTNFTPKGEKNKEEREREEKEEEDDEKKEET